jgi:hypothetical protein
VTDNQYPLILGRSVPGYTPVEKVKVFVEREQAPNVELGAALFDMLAAMNRTYYEANLRNKGNVDEKPR